MKTQIWIAVSIYLLVVALRQCGTRSRTMRTCGKSRFFMSQTRKIITSVAFMRAAAVCPRFSCISLAREDGGDGTVSVEAAAPSFGVSIPIDSSDGLERAPNEIRSPL